MIRMKAIGVLVVFLAVSAASCGSGELREGELAQGAFAPADRDAVRIMLEGVSALNKKSPASFRADFRIDGSAGARKYSLLGSAEFSRRERLLHVAFMDFIFKSPVATFLQDGDAIRIYYPIEKKMFVDSVTTFDLANYGGVGIGYDLLYDIATGAFPLIRGYRVKQGLAENGGNGSMLVLENGTFYETISLKGGTPDKILLINRKTREKLEVYIKKIISQDSSVFFSNVVVVSIANGLRLNIDFSKVKLNVPVKVKTVKDMAIPGNVKVYTM
jgi:hypothetical protein